MQNFEQHHYNTILEDKTYFLAIRSDMQQYQFPTEYHNQQQVLQCICDVFNHCPFFQYNQLEMKVIDQTIVVYVKMQPHLVGNFHFNILHGGAIATILDTIGGALAIAELYRQGDVSDIQKITHKASRLATLDMRVDYIRPGKGEYFIATAEAVRVGQKSSTIRMNLHNDTQKLIATAIASYSF